MVCDTPVNRNTVPGDKSALRPGGIRIGTPALTSRNFFEKDVEQVVEFMVDALNLAKEISTALGKSTLKIYKEALEKDEWKGKISELRKHVEEFAIKYPMPGPSPLQ